MKEWITPAARWSRTEGSGPDKQGRTGSVEEAPPGVPIIKLADGRSGSAYTSPRYATPLMWWQRVDPKGDYPDDLVVYTNYWFEEALTHDVRTRVAWLGESRGVAWWTYEFIEDHLEAFDHVLTHDESIVAMDPEKCIFIPRGECWIDAEHVALYDKTRLVSFISSKKKFDTWSATGHGLRQHLFQILSRKRGCLGRMLDRSGMTEKIDLYGSITGVKLPTKLPSLEPYMFQITVENMVHDTYFTEKLIDCFATGTIPIYRGTRKVDRYFDTRGILFFDTLEDLTEILVGLTEQDYFERMDAVRENYRRAAAFFSREELICRNSDLLSWVSQVAR